MHISVEQLKELIREAVEEVMEEKELKGKKLKGKQHKLDVAPPFGKLTGADFKKLHSMKKNKPSKSRKGKDKTNK